METPMNMNIRVYSPCHERGFSVPTRRRLGRLEAPEGRPQGAEAAPDEDPLPGGHDGAEEGDDEAVEEGDEACHGVCSGRHVGAALLHDGVQEGARGGVEVLEGPQGSSHWGHRHQGPQQDPQGRHAAAPCS